MVQYKALANELAQLIEAGELRPGERLPSLRDCSRRRALSVSTVLKAYHLLEARGFVQATQRSGFHVNIRADQYPQLPSSSQPDIDTVQVGKSDLIGQVLHGLKNQNVVPMGSAFPDPALFPLARLSQSLSRSMRKLDPSRTVMDIAPGNPGLLRQIALRYHLQGFELDTDELLVTNGAMEALNLCLQAVTRPGDAVVIESPSFYVCLQALERLGLRAIEVATDPRQGMDLEALEVAITRHRPAAVWLMSNFQNPLGSLMPESCKRSLAELLVRHQLPLIEDDVYGELYFGKRRPPPVKAFDKAGLVLHCGSFSKCLAPGYRIGWAAAGRFSRQVQQLQLGTSLSAALPSQLALADYLETGAFDTHLRGLRAVLQRRRDAMLDCVQRFFPADCRVTQPQGGYFLWLELPAHYDSYQLYKAALKQGVSIAPGNLFAARDDAMPGFRLNYGHPSIEEAERAMQLLATLLPVSKSAAS
ncbi:PLP-dependent aminotransferase family protein [Granulosicoccus antarcticus]|uniref:HTH-type transcriptional regulator NorG n=1 Tax=Granulosicoccus antarcticus IMCC3135 TaxID=1192854 RepID=A0A2Z2NHW0_9GAMM|nr:PLP-dependent aminotransferase family protein [Granulosicoccus antarcticus]ASJ70882.1 HTH-type transcriptional regulator NorG [Granulosicoccus antarcticus IMCC3135]